MNYSTSDFLGAIVVSSIFSSVSVSRALSSRHLTAIVVIRAFSSASESRALLSRHLTTIVVISIFSSASVSSALSSRHLTAIVVSRAFSSVSVSRALFCATHWHCAQRALISGAILSGTQSTAAKDIRKQIAILSGQRRSFGGYGSAQSYAHTRDTRVTHADWTNVSSNWSWKGVSGHISIVAVRKPTLSM